MRQFYSPRTRLFRKSRIGLRHAVLPLLAIGFVYVGLQGLNNEREEITQTVDVAMTPYVPVESASHLNLKNAFDTPPAPSSVRFDENGTKPVVVEAPIAAQNLSTKISAIQSGISNLLQAGTDILTSSKKVAVGKGDTLMELLVRNDVPREEAYEAIQALSKVYDPRNLNVGHQITVFFNKDPSIADPKFSGLSIEKDTINTVTVNRDSNGGYKAGQEEKQVARSLRSFSGTIDGSLYMAAKAQGIPDGIILEMIKLYSWNVDFQRDIQPGDSFEVMYEEYTTDAGDVVKGMGNILYTKLALGGRVMPLYRFEDAAGDVGYYDEEGQSAKRPLMKTPVDGARLSSGFGMRRHPVLGYSKMHKGVDFAAPRGTPIYAAGDGTIVKIGPFSSYGKYVKIRHRAGLETAYAHMNGFKPGLKNGSRVKQGQVIGYVGTTGRSTGPHLHYEVLVAGKAVNPNSIKLPTGKALAGKDLKAFQSKVAEVARTFNKDVASPAVASR